ncbi:MAG: Transcriptional repressor NrdR [Candidatus Uhrbacteria bacterium GW2011_GWF2_41_16]|uniref:Transcriptional repressor NrdR n=2 Tax=Candidatus Uhriibacteriota TaxID=1752732 RepID=A0A0G0VD15_9BACT|nr:MAG: Transcriptional repressor NrdR [Candidatus Uhrbacteria bacterium GW2011_GWA2_41_10]KKR87835.1 MAG: Transcriptional repressor NrdR [Candidatus Uhrbacteria bacterium GW2011_GWC2_41_11]KKR98774.1 MAG: Transcriptional repressor NrdR [Candidatus Uhrbacteria bacterium GW2011_GWF2_41_16]HBP00383.1 transcriptional regulator NrdR [Candidatus Uhrbacteria bacterium]
MRCPACNHSETKVVDSRMSADGASIRRRRECEACDFRFSTMEEIELLDLAVIKRDGRKEVYAREKLVRGLEKALEKRPYVAGDLQKLVHKIERDIQKKHHGEMTSRDIGEIVMKHLRGFDKIAYIRFASVYRSFEDVQKFDRELRKLLAGSKNVSKRRGLLSKS